MKDPWVDRLLARPGVRVKVQILILFAEISSLASLVAGLLIIFLFIGGGV
jgi:hypothetical protein